MKYIKKYNESTKKDISDEFKLFLDNNFDDEDYKINDDGTVDVFNDVWINANDIMDIVPSLDKIPFKFNIVDGDFGIDLDVPLTSLDNFPKKVKGTLDISKTKITSLKGCPDADYIDISSTNITSLEYCGECHTIDMSRTLIETLEFLPKTVKRIEASCSKLKEVRDIDNDIEFIELDRSSNFRYLQSNLYDKSSVYLTKYEGLISYLDKSITPFKNDITEKEIAERIEEFDIVNGDKIYESRLNMLISLYIDDHHKIEGYEII